MGERLLLALNESFAGKLTNDTPLAVWARVNNGFENREVAPGEVVDHALGYHPFCAPHAHFRHTIGTWPDGRPKLSTFRHQLNWQPTNVAALDIDNTPVGMEQFADQNRGIVTFSYETTSNTAEAPRYRVGIQLPKVVRSVTDFRLLLSALNYKFRGYGADISASDVVKSYSGTVDRAGVIVDPSAVASPDFLAAVVREYIQYKEESAAARREYGHDSNPLEIDEIARMLSVMPVRQAYLDWVKTIFAVLSATSPEIAERLIEEWSPGKRGEVATVIRSAQNGTTVNIGWLIVAARRRGWKPERLSDEARVMRRMAYGN